MTAAELVEVEPEHWDGLLARLGVTDVYLARGYLTASSVLTAGRPALLHLAGEDGDVVFALLLRDDPADVVTPYGYGGPVAVGTRPPVAAFAGAYARWCAARAAVTSFVVYHPLFANQAQAGPTGFRASALAGTVAWPLTGDDPAAGMHKHHRRLVRRAAASGLVAAVDPAPTDLAPFVALYDATMRRAGAAPFYRFPDAYWAALLDEVPLVRVDVRDPEGALVAAVLGMGEPPWLHYHLGGAAEAGRGSGASHLALLTLAEWGRDHGHDTLHLGGGVGGQDDSLLQFKRRFAPDGLRAAAVGKAVHDPAAYARLTGAAEIDRAGFFPAYRAPR